LKHEVDHLDKFQNILIFILIVVVLVIIMLVFYEEPNDEIFGYQMEQTSCPTPACGHL